MYYRADMRVDVITKEYPPEIYGGAGVHVAELVAALRTSVDVQVRAFGADRDEAGTFAYRTPTELAGANAAIQTLGTDLAMVGDIAAAAVVHSHTWYANFAVHIASQVLGISPVSTSPRLVIMLSIMGESHGFRY